MDENLNMWGGCPWAKFLVPLERTKIEKKERQASIHTLALQILGVGLAKGDSEIEGVFFPQKQHHQVQMLNHIPLCQVYSSKIN